MKVCSKCKEEKDECEFNKSKGKPFSQCRACIRRYQRENRDKINAIQLRYRLKNKDKINEGRRAKRKKKNPNGFRVRKTKTYSKQQAYIMDNITKQICNRCGEDKPITSFHTSKGIPLKQCKACLKKRVAERQEAYEAYNADWRQKWKSGELVTRLKVVIELDDLTARHLNRKAYLIGKGKSADGFDRQQVKKTEIIIGPDDINNDYSITLNDNTFTLNYYVSDDSMLSVELPLPRHPMSGDANYVSALIALKMGVTEIVFVGVDQGDREYYEKLLRSAQEYECFLLSKSDPEGVLSSYPRKKVRKNAKVVEEVEQEIDEEDDDNDGEVQYSVF